MNKINKIKNKITNYATKLCYYIAAMTSVSLIAIYIAGAFCLPVVIVWAIYKIVTHFTN